MKINKAFWGLASITLLCLGLSIAAWWQPISDFANYYFGSLFFLEDGFNQNIYEPYLFNQHIWETGSRGIFANYTPVPPFSLLCYLPLNFWNIYTAKLVFNLLGSALFIISLWRLFQHYSIRVEYLLLIPFIFFIPIRSNLFFGQSYFFIFVFLSEGLIALNQNRHLRMALFWSLAGLLKVFPFIVILHLVLTKQWKGVLYLSVTTLVLVGVSGFFIPPAVWIDYVTEILPRMQQGEIHDSFTWIFQSMSMLLKNLLVQDTLLNPSPFFHQPWAFTIASAVYVSTILTVIVLLYQTSKANNLFRFSSLMIGGDTHLWLWKYLWVNLVAFSFTKLPQKSTFPRQARNNNSHHTITYL